MEYDIVVRVYDMVWYGMVWYGMVWYVYGTCMVWYVYGTCMVWFVGSKVCYDLVCYIILNIKSTHRKDRHASL